MKAADLAKNAGDLSYEAEIAETRRNLVIFLVLAGLLALVRSNFVLVLGILPAVYFVWLTLFHGATALSLHLEGACRRAFQVFVAAALPLLASVYFLKSVPSLDLVRILSEALTPWLAIPLLVAGFAGKAGGAMLNREHPFRGFMIAATAVFVLCYVGYHGAYSESDGYDEGSSWYIDRDLAHAYAQSGKHFFIYLLEVAASYIGLLVGMRTG